MAGFPVTCTKYGQTLRDVNEIPRPKCGDTRRTVYMEARSGSYLMAGGKLSMTAERIREEVEKNWKWIVGTLAIDLVSIFAALKLQGIASAVATVIAILVTTYTGYRAVTKVRVITRETR